jgi:uncharacterized RDD family membrane protein YckC
VTSNPYAPPRAAAPPPKSTLGGPAPRTRRALGSVLDGLLTFVAGVLLSHVYAWALGIPRSVTVVYACVLLASAVQWGLVAWRGQTLGKMLVQTRIVLADGSNPGFLRGVVLRAWPLYLIQALPPLLAMPSLRAFASLLFMVDAICIASTDRRCAHDHVAGTFVVNVRPERDPVPDERLEEHAVVRLLVPKVDDAGRPVAAGSVGVIVHVHATRRGRPVAYLVEVVVSDGAGMQVDAHLVDVGAHEVGPA